MIGDQDVTVINGDVPLNRVALEMAEFTVGDARAIYLIMESLAQDGVVSLDYADVLNQKVAHDARLFAANVDLCHRSKAAHCQPFDHTV